MSVWKSDEKLLIFASLISPSKIILFEKYYQAFDTVFHHQLKHLDVRQKFLQRVVLSHMKHCVSCLICNSLLTDETLGLMLDILGFQYELNAA